MKLGCIIVQLSVAVRYFCTSNGNKPGKTNVSSIVDESEHVFIALNLTGCLFTCREHLFSVKNGCALLPSTAKDGLFNYEYTTFLTF